MDPETGGPGDRTGVWHPVPSCACVAHLTRHGLQLPETGTAGTGTGRRSHPTVAQNDLRSNKKAQAENKVIVISDESGFMLQPVVRRPGRPREKRPSSIVGIAITAFLLSQRWSSFLKKRKWAYPFSWWLTISKAKTKRSLWSRCKMRSDQDLLRSLLCWTDLGYSPFFSKCKHQ